MVDVAVTLPESRPEDDEDVVWGLSTAAALWARGEHGDAIVWLRRAADAAAAAGQEARAGELGTATTRAEQTLERIRRRSVPPPVEAPPLSQAPVEDRVSLGIEVDIESIPPPPRTPTVSPTQPAPAAAPPPEAAAAPRTASLRAHLPSYPPHVVAKVMRGQAPAPDASATPPPPEASREGPASGSKPRPPAEAIAAPVPSARKSAGQRVPILDPWSDEPTQPNLRIEPLHAVQLEGDELVVQMRRNLPRVIEEDDGVITSAAPLDHTMRRVTRPPTPPARKWTASGEQPPGHIAEASTSVASKVPGGSKRPPPVPSSPAAVSATPAPPVAAPAPAPAAVPAPTPVAVPAPTQVAAHAPPAPAATPIAPAAAVPAPGPDPSDPHNVPTQPATPSPIARPRSITVPPPAPGGSVRLPAAPTRVAIPSLAALAAATTSSPITPPAPFPAAAPASLRSGPTSVRPPPGPASVRPPPPAAPAAPAAAATVPRPPARPSSMPASPEAPRPTRPKGSSAPAAPAAPRPRAPASVAPVAPGPARPALDAGVLDKVETLAGLPPEARARLASLARIEVLGAGDEVSRFGAALLVEGSASVGAIAEPVSPVAQGVLVTSRGTQAEAVALRLVAGAAGARVAVWDQTAVDDALRAHPQVADALAAHADRLQALAAASTAHAPSGPRSAPPGA
jgi:hypothetical protein